MERWKKDTRFTQFFRLVDGAVTTAVGLFPFAVLGAGIWWFA